jgi:hypothetical protein
MAATKAIRVTEADHERLLRLTSQTSMKQHEVITRALDMLEREVLLDSINAGFEALQGDPVAWRDELAERALWDLSNTDGGTDR